MFSVPSIWDDNLDWACRLCFGKMAAFLGFRGKIRQQQYMTTHGNNFVRYSAKINNSLLVGFHIQYLIWNYIKSTNFRFSNNPTAMWGFPKMVVPPKHPRYHHLRKPPCSFLGFYNKPTDPSGCWWISWVIPWRCGSVWLSSTMIASIRPLERPGIWHFWGWKTGADWVGGCGAKWFDFRGVPFFGVGVKGFWDGYGCSFNDLTWFV